MDYFVLACEILFMAFTVYYTVEETLEVSRKGEIELFYIENKL